MLELALPWLSSALVVGILGCLLVRRLTDESLRRGAIITSVLLLLATAGAAVEVAQHDGGALVDPLAVALGAPGGVLRVDALSALLLPFTALLWLVVLVVAPRAELGRRQYERMLFAELVVLAVFMCSEALVIAALWSLSVLVLVVELKEGGDRRLLRLVGRYLGASAVLFTAGTVLVVVGGEEELGHVGLGLLFAAVMIRKGIVPGHSWMPELFRCSSLGSAILFSAPQIGAYALATLLVPSAASTALVAISALSLATAVYGAAMSLVQRDARSAFGYLFMSQSALVMSGLETTSIEGLTGAICLWVSSGIALAGFGVTVWMLEARLGTARLSLTRMHGGYERMPLLASSFLLLGLASVGFPGTLGFVAEELLIEGTVQQLPHMGFAVVVAAALAGISVVRMYFALFCGRAEGHIDMRLRKREMVVVVTLVAALVVGGLVPGPLVRWQERAATFLLEGRAGAHALVVKERPSISSIAARHGAGSGAF